MELIYIGKIVNTHGLKGEMRIISDFKYKNEVFKINHELYINKNKYIINSYRKHKMFDMVTLSNVNTIDDALEIKGSSVYIDKKSYAFNGYLDEELIGLNVYDKNNYKGKITDIYKTSTNDLFVIEGIKRHMVPNVDTFIEKVDLKNKKIYINYIKGLDNED